MTHIKMTKIADEKRILKVAREGHLGVSVGYVSDTGDQLRS